MINERTIDAELDSAGTSLTRRVLLSGALSGSATAFAGCAGTSFFSGSIPPVVDAKFHVTREGQINFRLVYREDLEKSVRDSLEANIEDLLITSRGDPVIHTTEIERWYDAFYATQDDFTEIKESISELGEDSKDYDEAIDEVAVAQSEIPELELAGDNIVTGQIRNATEELVESDLRETMVSIPEITVAGSVSDTFGTVQLQLPDGQLHMFPRNDFSDEDVVAFERRFSPPSFNVEIDFKEASLGINSSEFEGAEGVAQSTFELGEPPSDFDRYVDHTTTVIQGQEYILHPGLASMATHSDTVYNTLHTFGKLFESDLTEELAEDMEKFQQAGVGAAVSAAGPANIDGGSVATSYAPIGLELELARQGATDSARIAGSTLGTITTMYDVHQSTELFAEVADGIDPIGDLEQEGTVGSITGQPWQQIAKISKFISTTLVPALSRYGRDEDRIKNAVNICNQYNSLLTETQDGIVGDEYYKQSIDTPERDAFEATVYGILERNEYSARIVDGSVSGSGLYAETLSDLLAATHGDETKEGEDSGKDLLGEREMPADQAFPQFQFDNQSSGYSNIHQGPAADDAETIEQLWGIEGEVTASPAIVDGMVIVGHGTQLVTYELYTGNIVWEKQLPGSLNAPVSVHDGRIFSGDTDGTVYAIDLQTGEIDWTLAFSGKSITGVVSDGENGYFGAMETGYRSSRLVSVTLETGDIQWEKRLNNRSSNLGAPSYDNGVLGFAIGDRVWAYDAERGERIFTEKVQYSTKFPVVSDGVIYHAHWSAALSDQAYSAWDIETGEMKIGADGEHGRAMPVVTGDSIYYTGDGTIHRVDKQTGDTRNQYSIPDSPSGAPLVAGDILYVACQDGSVLAYDITSGMEVFETRFVGSITTGIAISDGLLVFGTDQGLHVVH